MKKNVLVKVGERTETRTRTVPAQYDENGNLTAEETEEAYEVVVPVIEVQSVEMTAEEIAELQVAVSPEVRIEQLKVELARYDYIGVKLAMGVATKENTPKKSRTRRCYGSRFGCLKVRWDKWTFLRSLSA